MVKGDKSGHVSAVKFHLVRLIFTRGFASGWMTFMSISMWFSFDEDLTCAVRFRYFKLLVICTRVTNGVSLYPGRATIIEAALSTRSR